MFRLLGQLTARRPVALIVAWTVVLACAVFAAIRMGDAGPSEVGSFLQPDAPYNQAVSELAEAFPELEQRSYIVVIAEREQGLTESDLRWLDRVGRTAGRKLKRPYLSPEVFFLRPRLVSPDNEAAMVIVNLQQNYISPGSVRAVEMVEDLVRRDAPEGLTVEITGPGGIGRDYFLATRHAVHNTTLVTITLVLLILVIVYRSPIGALVPLVSIGVSVYLSMVALTVLSKVGWSVTNLERIFAIVLLFGAGVDYALFWIARYRENLGQTPEYDAAAYSATLRVSPAIVASAATTICGLLTLIAADLIPWQNAGKALAPVLLIALAAALTLTPAMARVLGRWLFWPVRISSSATLGDRWFWPGLANLVTVRPGHVLVVGLVLLGGLASFAPMFRSQFASLSQLPPGSSSRKGYEIATEHFGNGQLYPNTLLLAFDKAPPDDALEKLSRTLTGKLLDIRGVEGVYSLTSPAGAKPGRDHPSVVSGLISKLTRSLSVQDLSKVRSYYESPLRPVLRFEVLVGYEPFTLKAMHVVEQVEAESRELVSTAEAGGGARVMMTGFTPYIMGVRAVSGSDQLRIMVLATLVIAVIVMLLVRDWKLTGFMLLATWLTFGATMTLGNLFFIHVMGSPGLDYKVRLIVFVIIMAVGQDYNIFLVTRLLQEPGDVPLAEAVRRSIIRTGSVISSCGLIMAATLGSLWAGGLSLLQELGFAFALGILIDTFFVRPLLIPSFYLVMHRGARRAVRTDESRTSAVSADVSEKSAGSVLNASDSTDSISQ